MNDRIYLLKIQLTGIEPAIWRRFAVPANITLDRLHDVIQIVMGWTNSHLYEFSIGAKCYTESPEFKEIGLESGQYRLGDLIKQKGRTFHYLYDLGDNWEHELVLEDSQYSKHDPDVFLDCIDGELACPPEDVGGVIGYFNFCRILKNPQDEAYEDLMSWTDGGFNTKLFDCEVVNDELLKYFHWSRDRQQNW